MKTLFWGILCLSLFATLSAQEPAKAKKVWTNDDFKTVRSVQTPVQTPIQAPTQTATVHEPKTAVEVQTRIDLRVRWMGELRTMLQQSNDEVMYSTTTAQRTAAVTRAKLIERDIEDAKAEIERLKGRLAAMNKPVEGK